MIYVDLSKSMIEFVAQEPVKQGTPIKFNEDGRERTAIVVYCLEYEKVSSNYLLVCS